MIEDDRKPTLGEYVWTVITAVCAALVVVIVVLFATSCTPAQQQTLGSLASNPTTVTTLKIAACIQGAMAEEEQERLRQRREAERLAAEEADAIAEAAREHPPSVKQEIEKVLKDGAPK